MDNVTALLVTSQATFYEEVAEPRTSTAGGPTNEIEVQEPRSQRQGQIDGHAGYDDMTRGGTFWFLKTGILRPPKVNACRPVTCGRIPRFIS